MIFEPLSQLRESSFPHGAVQCIAHQFALSHHGLALNIAFTRVAKGSVDTIDLNVRGPLSR